MENVITIYFTMPIKEFDRISSEMDAVSFTRPGTEDVDVCVGIYRQDDKANTKAIKTIDVSGHRPVDTVNSEDVWTCVVKKLIDTVNDEDIKLAAGKFEGTEQEWDNNPITKCSNLTTRTFVPLNLWNYYLKQEEDFKASLIEVQHHPV